MAELAMDQSVLASSTPNYKWSLASALVVTSGAFQDAISAGSTPASFTQGVQSADVDVAAMAAGRTLSDVAVVEAVITVSTLTSPPPPPTASRAANQSQRHARHTG
jgi:hypothetical protein